MTNILRQGGKRAAKVVNNSNGEDGTFKVLILDIETAPNLAHVWGLWDQNVGINQVVEWSQVICFAARWYGEKKVHFHSDFHDGHDDMVRAAWNLLDEASAVVHYNGKAFGIKHLNREFLKLGLNPPRPQKDIDLLHIARAKFKFPSNKLDAVSQELGVGSKVKHEGMELWLACMKGDRSAWKRMKEYNVGDITITERVYERFLGWISNHPHPGMYTGELKSCSKCGDKRLVKRGFARTLSQVYQQYQCKNCGGYCRDKKPFPETATLTRAVSN